MDSYLEQIEDQDSIEKMLNEKMEEIGESFDSHTEPGFNGLLDEDEVKSIENMCQEVSEISDTGEIFLNSISRLNIDGPPQPLISYHLAKIEPQLVSIPVQNVEIQQQKVKIEPQLVQISAQMVNVKVKVMPFGQPQNQSTPKKTVNKMSQNQDYEEMVVMIRIFF